jgi:hypothetical protein
MQAEDGFSKRVGGSAHVHAGTSGTVAQLQSAAPGDGVLHSYGVASPSFFAKAATNLST